MGLVSDLIAIFRTDTKPRGFVTRHGQTHIADAAFRAWTSGDLSQMLQAIDTPTNPIDRHFLLQNIVQLTYKDRKKNQVLRELCQRISRLHLSEIPHLTEPLKREFDGRLPRIVTFQHFATLLTEAGEYEEAVTVCQMALDLDLHDNTTGGFEARIGRIKKKQTRNIQSAKSRKASPGRHTK